MMGRRKKNVKQKGGKTGKRIKKYKVVVSNNYEDARYSIKNIDTNIVIVM